MELQQAISLINDALRGIDDDAPLEATDEWNYWTRVINRKKSELYHDVTRAWSIAYDVKSVGTVAAGAALSFPLDTSFIAPSGAKDSSGIYVIVGGKRIDLDLVKPQERPTSRAVFIGGENPRTLYFSDEVLASDPIVGGTLYVSGYYMPADVASATDKLPFLDAYWAVLASAAEIAGNDVTYEDKEANLTAKANSLYENMVSIENRGVPGATKKSLTSVKRIRGF